ncbi:hypothetical protein GCM10023196_023320 [Actinoallomurus vinaceus]|uniref:Uncharacterized protein n=1 Tax=Actinoallomurus vinaceus TaxID=1080074 RepID=A0ABP8U898_9ACTN
MPVRSVDRDLLILPIVWRNSVVDGFTRKEVLRMQEIAKLVLAGTADGGALGEYAREYASVSPNHDKKDN